MKKGVLFSRPRSFIKLALVECPGLRQACDRELELGLEVERRRTSGTMEELMNSFPQLVPEKWC